MQEVDAEDAEDADMDDGKRRNYPADYSDAAATPCHPQLIALLGCFATSGDLRATAACAESAKALAQCVAEGKRGGGRGAKGSVSLRVCQRGDEGFAMGCGQGGR